MTGITLLLDLHDCKSPALNNEALLEQLLVSALQFAGLQVMDQVSHRLPDQGALVMCMLRDAYAALRVMDGGKLVVADLSIFSQPGSARAELENVRGYLTQKLIARSVDARWIERGANAGV